MCSSSSAHPCIQLLDKGLCKERGVEGVEEGPDGHCMGQLHEGLLLGDETVDLSHLPAQVVVEGLQRA